MITVERAVYGSSTYPDWIKRSLDIALGGILGIILIPVGLMMALLVKASSPGPVLFRQERVGKGGRLFRIYKFRTMRVGPTGPNVTSGSDSRLTLAGRFLRKWKMDELPQLINVLRGEISLVGQRAEVAECVQL